MNLLLSRLESPLNDLLLVTDTEHNIRALEFATHEGHLHRGLHEHYGSPAVTDAPAPAEIAHAIARYFSGELKAVDSLITATTGSDLQRRVWAATRHVPAGTTTTYGRLAKELGFDDRRVAIDIGAAIGANPVAIIVPCHRVIASNGELRGYAWGLHRKRWLLTHENAIQSEPERPQSTRLPGF
jgi:methylated-DNA-[protein]-cysteine S-methyltransferase